MMAKHKYKFNPESLSYDKIHFSFKKKILRVLPHLSVSFLLAAIFYFFVFNYLFDSPKERKLKSENANLLLQYEILNKKIADKADVPFIHKYSKNISHELRNYVKESLSFGELDKTENTATCVVAETVISVKLAGLVDQEKEQKRIAQEIT